MKKITQSWIYSFVIMGVFLMIISGCQKKDDNNNTPPTTETVTDKDGNVYHTVSIGTQTWLVENLKTTKYNDGTAIPLVTDNTFWPSLITPGYCWYKHDSATYKNTYGALYNWYVVNTGKLCPIGWHVPTDAEWTTLATYLGGDTVAGGKMKAIGTIEAGTGLWVSPNTGATNESGFTAVPAGGRYIHGAFGYLGGYGNWWSSSEDGMTAAWVWYVSCYTSYVKRAYDYKSIGFSVRCVRDF